MPIDWAMENLPGYATNHTDKTVRGHRIEVARLPDPHHPNASPGQAQFFAEVNAQTQDFYTCLAQAPTGAGKTVTALNAIGHAKRSALAIVPNTGLSEQWVKEAVKHLGIDPKRIGKVGGGGHRWQDCDLVIAVINSVALVKQDPAFYKHFGFVVWDEAHRLGAQEFSKTMALFPARFKLALTATPDRKDGMDEVVFNYFGRPAAVAQSEALATDCHCIRFPLIGQLETLFDLCVAVGIPRTAMGPYTGTWRGKKLGKGYLNKVKDNATIQFATYAKAKEGYDCPRLDCGIEATPVADNVQGIGRVRRPLHGKKKPLWFSVMDLNADLFLRYSKARLRGFEKVNVNIIEQP